MKTTRKLTTTGKIMPFVLLAITVTIALAGMRWFMGRETPDNAAGQLQAQQIDVSRDGFITTVKSGNLGNIHLFNVIGMYAATQDSNGVSGLMAAASIDNAAIQNLMLGTLPNDKAGMVSAVNLQDNTGKTALMIAASRDDAILVHKLLARYADATLSDQAGETALIIAVKHNYSDLVPLLAGKAKSQQSAVTVGNADSTGDTPLIYAIRERSPETVKTLIETGADVSSGDLAQVTPLMVAAKIGDEVIGNALIKAGAKPNVADHYGNTPLTIAISHKNSAFAKLLLEHGADPDFHTTGPLPVEVVMQTEPFDADLFTYMVGISKQVGTISSALLFDAVDHKNAPISQMLIARATDLKTVNAAGESILYHAIQADMPDIAMLLIDKGADTTQTGAGITPLYAAFRHHMPKVMDKLLQAGATPDQRTSEGYTLAETAIYTGEPELLEVLLNHNAKVEKDFGILWSIRDGKGKCVSMLLQHGANPNVSNEQGDPALWLAAASGEVEAAQALIAHQVAIDNPNRNQGMPPLAAAANTGQLATVKVLTESGAKLEARDSSGMTALAHAAYSSRPDVVQYLISKGANTQSADNRGRTVSELAGLASPSDARTQVMGMLQRGK